MTLMTKHSNNHVIQ